MTAATTMVPQDPPVVETSNRVLDSSSTSTMPTPRTVAQDPGCAKHRRDELWNAAVPAIGKDATMVLGERLDARASVVHRVVAIAWTAREGGDYPQIASADDDLCVA